MSTFLISLIINFLFFSSGSSDSLQGAWKSDNGVFIFSGNYFAFTEYTPSEFKNTYGGSCKINRVSVELAYEFNTLEPEKVGTSEVSSIVIHGNIMNLGNQEFTRLDNGTPGKLNGTWLFANRVTNGHMGTARNADSPRKTMKILSGARFQWIAYNVETKEFMGTGGGTYTTENGKYTENIDFFSRDNSRVGASLEFDYEIKGDDWHHQGLNSRGEPMYEIWSRRN